MQSSLHICGEVGLPIHHFVLVACACPRGRDAGLLPLPVVRPVPASARHPPAEARAGRRDQQRRGGRLAAQDPAPRRLRRGAARIYGLDVLAPNIRGRAGEHHALPRHRRRPVPPTGADKTSLLLAARNQAGCPLSAPRALLTLRHQTMNRSNRAPRGAESGTTSSSSTSDGHAQDPDLASALREVSERSAVFKVLGSYRGWCCETEATRGNPANPMLRLAAPVSGC